MSAHWGSPFHWNFSSPDFGFSVLFKHRLITLDLVIRTWSTFHVRELQVSVIVTFLSLISEASTFFYHFLLFAFASDDYCWALNGKVLHSLFHSKGLNLSLCIIPYTVHEFILRAWKLLSKMHVCDFIIFPYRRSVNSLNI